MEGALTSPAPAGISDQGFKRFVCDFCRHEMRFQIGAEGSNAECPNCARVVRLGAAPVEPTMDAVNAVAERRRISHRSRSRQVLRTTGWCLFVGSVGVLGALALTPFAPQESLGRVTTLALTLVTAGVGVVLMIEGGRQQTHWECSACGGKLDSWQDIACSNCRVTLR